MALTLSNRDARVGEAFYSSVIGQTIGGSGLALTVNPGNRYLLQNALLSCQDVRAGDSVTITDNGTPYAFAVVISSPSNLTATVNVGSATVGSSTAITPSISGGTPPYNLYVLGQMPAGRTLNGLSVTGSYASTGYASYALRVVDSKGALVTLPIQETVTANAGPTPPPTSIAFDFTSGSLPSDVTVSGATNGSRIDSSGLVVPSNSPRFDYATGTAGLLIEPQSTNLLLYSKDPSNAVWTKGQNTGALVPTYNAAVSPSGANDATQWVLPATAEGQYAGFDQTVTGWALGEFGCAGIWLRSASAAQVQIVVQDAVNGTPLSFSQVTLTSTWTCYTVPFVHNSNTNQAKLFVGGLSFSGSGTSPNAGGTFQSWNAQIEKLATSTSDIITTNAAVTRTADTLAFSVPAGIDRLQASFAVGGVQHLQCAPSTTYTLPSLLNRTKGSLSRIDGRSRKTAPISTVTYGTPHRYNETAGRRMMSDTFAPAWHADGRNYTGSCDTDRLNWDSPDRTTTRNALFSTLSTSGPDAIGRTINPMTEFGTAGQNVAGVNTNYKINSTISVDTEMFATIAVATYGDWTGTPGRGYRQLQQNVQIIKSATCGLSFAPLPSVAGASGEVNHYASPMFPTDKIGTLTFVQGVNRAYRNEPGAGMDQYVYVVGGKYWNDADTLLVGRVLRSELTLLDASKFSWRQADGSWGAGNGAINTAAPILSVPGKLGIVNPFFDAEHDRVLLIAGWYESYVNGGGIVTTNPDTTFDTTWNVYEGANLWSLNPVPSGTKRWNAAQGTPGRGLYPPSVVANSWNGGSVNLITAGDFADQDQDTGAYCATWVPLALSTS